MNRPSFVLASLLAVELVSGAASAQNAPAVQGMPPVSSPNAPATQTPPPAFNPPPAPTVAPTYKPVPVPTAPTLAAPPGIPGGTSTGSLGAAGTGNNVVVDDSAAQAEHAVTAQITALIGRPGGLTSDQAALRAKQTSYDVRAKKAEADAAQSTVDQATAAYVPRIKGTASYQRTSPVSLDGAAFFGGAAGAQKLGLNPSQLVFSYPQDNWNLQADLDVPLSDYVLKTARQYASAKHSARAAELTEKASELTAASNARISYYGWARAKLNLVVAQASLDSARQTLADVKAQFAAGKASQADVLASQSNATQTELFVTQTADALALEEDRLRTALHDQSGTQYEIGEPLLADLPPMQSEDKFDPLFEEALEHRYELRAITETARGLRSLASSQKSDILPKLDGIGTAQYANPNPRYFPPQSVWNGSWAIGAALTWSDTDILLGLTNGSANEARAQSTEAQALSMRDGIRDEVLQAFQAVREAEIAIRSTQDALAAAEESFRVRRALFRAERATSTELTVASTSLTQARFQAVNARIDLRIARVRLAHATGRDAGDAR